MLELFPSLAQMMLELSPSLHDMRCPDKLGQGFEEVEMSFIRAAKPLLWGAGLLPGLPTTLFPQGGPHYSQQGHQLWCSGR